MARSCDALTAYHQYRAERDV